MEVRRARRNDEENDGKKNESPNRTIVWERRSGENDDFPFMPFFQRSSLFQCNDHPSIRTRASTTAVTLTFMEKTRKRGACLSPSSLPKATDRSSLLPLSLSLFRLWYFSLRPSFSLHLKSRRVSVGLPLTPSLSHPKRFPSVQV